MNFLIRELFKKIASFEAYNYFTEELRARIKKIFIAMFINTGLIIFVINIDFYIEKE
jgi:hypothetical protein